MRNMEKMWKSLGLLQLGAVLPMFLIAIVAPIAALAWPHRVPAPPQDKLFSPTMVRILVFPLRMLPTFSTRTTPSPPLSPSPKAGRRE